MPPGEPANTILLVEDEPLVLRLGRAVLERGGYTVLTAGTPDEALSIARSYAGDIHLLITDVTMPQMNGRDLSGRLAQTRPTMRTLFLSGYPASTLASTGALAAGATFLQKPFSLDQLTGTVAQILRRLA